MMNPGIAEEAGSTARQAIEVLKSTPVLLAILMFNMAWMGVTAWLAHSNGARWERILNAAFESCPTLQKQHAGFDLQSESSRPFTLPPLSSQGQPDSEFRMMTLQKPGASEPPLRDLPALTKP